MRVLSVFGTRPEAIKMCPLVLELQKTPGVESEVCVTGQHRQMLDQVLEVFGVSPRYDLNIMKKQQTLASITAAVTEGVGKVIDECKPDIVLVHGDTTTSFAAALGAFYRQVTVGHIEAGLRTYNKYSPYPEEMNRVLTGRIADFHFAPTVHNQAALAREGITKNVYVTGNTVIDSFSTTVQKDYCFKRRELRELDFSRRTILLTAHRRENLGRPLEQICEAILRLCALNEDIQVVFPVHLNPAVRETVFAMLGNISQVHLLEPLDVQDMHNVMARCFLVMTDSGGLQEEAPHLGKPVLVVRTETERPEAVEAGTAKVIGVETENIVEQTQRLLADQECYKQMATAKNPYGDGHASKRIVQHLLENF